MIMFASRFLLTRRRILATSAAVSVASLLSINVGITAEGDAIRPFRINIPEDQLVDLRRRIAMTRWPDRETAADQSQGVQLVKLQELMRYWGSDYDCERLRQS
jgi:hypothetical protein